MILRRVVLVRTRLNRLALQQGLFESLSLIVGTGAIVLLAAFLLQPLKFLCVAIVLGAALMVGLVRAIRRSSRMRATLERAAIIADQRTGLKGRLTTVVSIAPNATGRGQLWPYLLEDTLSLRDEFAPAKVEPRRISRSIYGLLAYSLLAILVAGFALMERRVQTASKAARADLEVDVNNLDVRPLDPDLGTAVEISGDPSAMRKLDQKLARAGEAQGESNSALGRLMGRARDLAGDIQDKMTGHESGSRLRLRLTDSNRGNSGDDAADSPHTPPEGSEARSDRAGDNHAPGDSPPSQAARNGSLGGAVPNPISRRRTARRTICPMTRMRRVKATSRARADRRTAPAPIPSICLARPKNRRWGRRASRSWSRRGRPSAVPAASSLICRRECERR